MICYRIVVAYDGTAYHGWQIQPDATTISKVLTDRFTSIFKKNISILGASRTDAGVHSVGQVAIVRCSLDLSPQKLQKVWNEALPDDIVITNVQRLEKLIHPHAGVVQKTYRYHFFLERPLPFFSRYGWYISKKINIEKLRKALQVFVGTHDFRSFYTGYEQENTVRTVDSIQLEYVQDMKAYRIVIKGKGFLRYMIRRIVGACLEVASKDNLSNDILQEILLKKNPSHTLPNAPAKGLLLYEILYDQGDNV